MYYMDGRSPSGFINSTYCGMNCTSREPAGIVKPYPQASINYSDNNDNNNNDNNNNNNNDPGNNTNFDDLPPDQVPIKSLWDIIKNCNSIWRFIQILWYNLWTLFYWYNF